MIEIEIDFNPDAKALDWLSRETEFRGEKTIHDVYFDTPDYALGRQDRWLRARNGRYELKTPIENRSEADIRTAPVSHYREIEDDAGIKTALGVSSDVSLNACLREMGCVPFCDVTTIRREYRSGEFSIDVDRATYAGTDFTFQTAEIEVMVERADQAADGERRLLAFAHAHGFVPLKTHGKIVEYIKRIRPEQFKILHDAKTV